MFGFIFKLELIKEIVPIVVPGKQVVNIEFLIKISGASAGSMRLGSQQTASEERKLQVNRHSARSQDVSKTGAYFHSQSPPAETS